MMNYNSFPFPERVLRVTSSILVTLDELSSSFLCEADKIYHQLSRQDFTGLTGLYSFSLVGSGEKRAI